MRKWMFKDPEITSDNSETSGDYGTVHASRITTS